MKRKAEVICMEEKLNQRAEEEDFRALMEHFTRKRIKSKTEGGPELEFTAIPNHLLLMIAFHGNLRCKLAIYYARRFYERRGKGRGFPKEPIKKLASMFGKTKQAVGNAHRYLMAVGLIEEFEGKKGQAYIRVNENPVKWSFGKCKVQLCPDKVQLYKLQSAALLVSEKMPAKAKESTQLQEGGKIHKELEEYIKDDEEGKSSSSEKDSGRIRKEYKYGTLIEQETERWSWLRPSGAKWTQDICRALEKSGLDLKPREAKSFVKMVAVQWHGASQWMLKWSEKKQPSKRMRGQVIQASIKLWQWMRERPLDSLMQGTIMKGIDPWTVTEIKEKYQAGKFIQAYVHYLHAVLELEFTGKKPYHMGNVTSDYTYDELLPRYGNEWVLREAEEKAAYIQLSGR